MILTGQRILPSVQRPTPSDTTTSQKSGILSMIVCFQRCKPSCIPSRRQSYTLWVAVWHFLCVLSVAGFCFHCTCDTYCPESFMSVILPVWYVLVVARSFFLHFSNSLLFVPSTLKFLIYSACSLISLFSFLHCHLFWHLFHPSLLLLPLTIMSNICAFVCFPITFTSVLPFPPFYIVHMKIHTYILLNYGHLYEKYLKCTVQNKYLKTNCIFVSATPWRSTFAGIYYFWCAPNSFTIVLIVSRDGAKNEGQYIWQ